MTTPTSPVKAGKILDTLGAMQSSMTRVGKSIAQYVIASPHKVTQLSIADLSEEVNAGEASVIRFCRQLGYKGFQNFKMELAIELAMWIRPLQAELSDNTLALYAPNRFVLDWVRDKYLNNINGLLNDFCGADAPQLRFEVGAKPAVQMQRGAVSVAAVAPAQQVQTARVAPTIVRPGWDNVPAPAEPTYRSNVNVKHTFDNFVEGKSNQLARAAARQVADNPGGAYNPLFLYGGTGLGKTHLLHAVGNGIVARKPNAKVVYMVRAGGTRSFTRRAIGAGTGDGRCGDIRFANCKSTGGKGFCHIRK